MANQKPLVRREMTIEKAAKEFLKDHDWVLWPGGALVTYQPDNCSRDELLEKAKRDLLAFNPKTHQEEDIPCKLVNIREQLGITRHVYLCDYTISNIYALLIPPKAPKDAAQDRTLLWLGLIGIQQSQTEDGALDEILATSKDGANDVAALRIGPDVPEE